MLRSLDEIRGYTLAARDGEFGRCKDFLFDDRSWVVRYMVADTGKWLPGRKVLLSPIFFGAVRWRDRHVAIDLTAKEIEEAPPLVEHAPVSRQHEKVYFDYYQFPYYWAGTDFWGSYPTPQLLGSATERAAAEDAGESVDEEDRYLRSAREVEGYRIRAADGEIGHVEDFILDDETWRIRYLVVDTRNWLPGGKKVLVSPDWVEAVDWVEGSVSVPLDVDSVKNSPEFDPRAPVNREYEATLYDFYGRPYYWE